jgi:hypothetical protein
MTSTTPPEDAVSSLNMLDPDYLSSLFPSGWDLSEHCKTRQPSSTNQLAAQEGAKPALAQNYSPATAGTDPFLYGPSPRSYRFLMGLYYSDFGFFPF